MAKVVTLGEIMMRFSPPGRERFMQAKNFDVNYGGGEANVAISLSNFGHEVYYVTKVPNNALGDCAIAALRKLNVNCNYVARGGKRLGIYYLENGESVRPSSVIYDRGDSSMSKATISDFDFDEIFKNVDLFHVSGITPVLSEQCAEITMNALKSAKKNNVTVSLDLNYRSKLWKYDIEEKQKLIENMMEYVDICFGNARDAAKVLRYSYNNIDFINSDYNICINEENMRRVLEKYNFTYLITTKRNSISASDNALSAVVCGQNKFYEGKEYNLHIVDRVGGGDAFAAGFLHGILSGYSTEYSLEFAIAASAIKHTIPGDINLATVEDIESLLEEDRAGIIKR